MEKMIYPVWKRDSQAVDAFRADLLGPCTEALYASGVKGLRVNVVDEDVAPAAGLRQANTRPLPDAILSLWVDSAVFRAAQHAVLDEHVARYHGYLVTESEPIVNTRHPVPAGERTPGMSQVVFLRKPPRLAYEQWLDIWHNSHTRIAIDTQDTFGYRQNVIVRALTYAAPAYDAMIEENFPAAAMTSQEAFYAAVGDAQKLQRNQQAMMDSCQRFIDFDKLDVMPTSEYLMRTP